MTMVQHLATAQRSFGIEEEVMLLDPDTLAPVDVAEEVIAELGAVAEEEVGDADGGIGAGDASIGWIGHEFLRAQVEFSSPVLADGAAASRVVGAFRSALAGAADRRGLVAASIGAPIGAGTSRVAEGDRYARFCDELGAIAADHRIMGLHVHVGVASRDEGVVAMRALRPWLAPLLALTANSPCFAGRDTGFASWRTIVGRRFTTASVPPDFADAADYDRRIRALVGLGTTLDLGSLAWMMRLAERYPTLELRLFDAQLRGGEAVAAALLSRALVEAAATGVLPHAAAAAQPELVDAGVWHAARHGLDDGLLHPETGELAPAWAVVERMLAHAAPALEASGDRALVDDAVARIRVEGTGAERQRAALAEGDGALRRLLRGSFVD